MLVNKFISKFSRPTYVKVLSKSIKNALGLILRKGKIPIYPTSGGECTSP